MNRKTSVLALVLVLILLLGMLSGCRKAPAADTTQIRVGVLKGPTGMGAIRMLDGAETGKYANYTFTLTPEPTDIVARLANGELDIGALPTNVAANLYKKTNGGVQIIAVNCLGVLYILENGDGIQSVSDLRGRTILSAGQGSNPEFTLNFILRQNGLEPGTDVDVQFADAGEIAAKMISGEADVCMLPVPAATTVLMKNSDVRCALDMTEQFAAASESGAALTQGCLVARRSFLEEHPAAAAQFLSAYADSVQEVLADIDGSAELIAKYEITGNAEIAKRALPDASIVCITGSDMIPALAGYYQVLFDADPASVGGAVPGEDFYYVPAAK